MPITCVVIVSDKVTPTYKFFVKGPIIAPNPFPANSDGTVNFLFDDWFHENAIEKINKKGFTSTPGTYKIDCFVRVQFVAKNGTQKLCPLIDNQSGYHVSENLFLNQI